MNLDITGSKAAESNWDLANLTYAKLDNCDLSNSRFVGTLLHGTSICNSNMANVVLNMAVLVGTTLHDSNLNGARVHGISAWDIDCSNTKQDNLTITGFSSPRITVDNIELAQFIYLLMKNKNLTNVIQTIGKKGVLILGRFTEQRRIVLDNLRENLRLYDLVPIVFDFDRPANKDITETIQVLAGLSCFIIADITNPKSSSLELQALIPNLMVPFVPILQEDEQPFSMFRDLHNKYDWVLPILNYQSIDDLVSTLREAIIKPAMEKLDELNKRKAESILNRHTKDYIP